VGKAPASFPKILLTGPPGVGKTTVVVRLAALLGAKAAGFYTAELRENSRRVGFTVTTIGGKEGVLAHVNFSSRYRVGKYGVNPASLDPACKAIEAALRGKETGYLLIDEIGKMELMVPGFRELIIRVFQNPMPLVAAVPLKSLPFTDALKNRPDVMLIHVSTANRDKLHLAIYKEITAHRHPIR
jgi:nucleoside-triphosphatase